MHVIAPVWPKGAAIAFVYLLHFLTVRGVMYLAPFQDVKMCPRGKL